MSFIKCFTVDYVTEDRAHDDSTLQICVVKLDHMRSEDKYIKLLNSWARTLGIYGKLLKITSSQNIYVVLFGCREDLSEYIRRWKTYNVDVDSRGRPCKERMMHFLCREEIDVAREKR